MGAMYDETSAKENIGIEAVFERLCKGMLLNCVPKMWVTVLLPTPAMR